MKYITGLITGIKTHSTWLGAFLSFLIPVATLFSYLFVFIIVDLITGIKASQKEGKVITSNGIRRTISKMLSYFSIVLLCHLIDLMIGSLFGEISFMNMATGLIAFTELLSVCENLYRITGLEIFYIFTQFSIKKFIELFKVSHKKEQ